MYSSRWIRSPSTCPLTATTLPSAPLLAVGQADRGAAAAVTREPVQPAMVRPKSATQTPGRAEVSSHRGRRVSITRIGSCSCAARCPPGRPARRGRGHAESSKPDAVPAAECAAGVVRLAGVQGVGEGGAAVIRQASSVTTCVLVRPSCTRSTRRAIRRARRVQGVWCQRHTFGRGHAEEPAAELGADHVVAGAEQVADVVGDVQHGVVVGGEAGVEDRVSSPPGR